MVNFFPTIYPDELWYSVISRYHIWAGTTSSAATMRQLFPDRLKESIGCSFPNNLIHMLSKNLPDDVFDAKDIILNHTLFKYFCRIGTNAEKQNMLINLCHGKTDFSYCRKQIAGYTPNRLNFCPICKKEDEENYGESYWHLSHQIPSSNICIKHKCYLVPLYTKNAKPIKDSFILPDDYQEEYDVNYDVLDYELNLAKTFNDYLYLPLLAGPTQGYNNLFQGLLNKGYGTGLSNYGWMLNVKRLNEDLIECFSAELVRKMTGRCMTSFLATNMRNWSYRSPERYVLLSTFINQKAEITFSSKRLEDEFKLKLLELRDRKKLMLSSSVASELGITMITLEKVSEYYNVTPFWTDKLEKKTFKLSLTEKEKEIVDKYYKENGYETGAQFLRECIMKVVDLS